MGQDKYIRKHQDFLEKMRESVREDKKGILSKLDIDLILSSPRESLLKLAEEYYGSKTDLINKSIKSGKKLADSMIKSIKNDKS